MPSARQASNYCNHKHKTIVMRELEPISDALRKRLLKELYAEAEWDGDKPFNEAAALVELIETRALLKRADA